MNHLHTPPTDDALEKELSELSQTIKPSADHLQKILRELSITPQPEPRYTITKGRSLYINFISTMNIKTTSGIIAVAVIAVVSVYAGYSQFNKTNPTDDQIASNTSTFEEPVRETLVVPPAPATSNIDDIAAAFTQELDQESTIVNESNSDADLIAYDSATLNTYSNLYEDNEL